MGTTLTRAAAKTARHKAAPAAPRRARDREAPSAGEFLAKELARRSRTFRKRLRRGLPRRRAGIDEAVHDLRTASRKLLSVLAAAEPWGPRKTVQRVRRRVHDVLDRLGPTRDLTVQRELLARMTIAAPTGALRAFARALDQEFARSVRKVRRRLARVDAEALRDDVRRIKRRLRDTRKPRGTRRDVVKAVALAFSSLQRRRVAVDPTALETVHRMRISLKEFRYLVRSVAPLVPGVSTPALDTLHDLQTTMGDLHDIEVLSASLAASARGDAQRTAQVSAVLADLEAHHSGLLRSFLKSADAVLARWRRTALVLPARRRT
jgi:CHAD domain-containing protein